jgi:hypothetical protein
MEQLLKTRQEIYDYFDSNEPCQEFFFDSSREEKYVAYYTSMYLILNATESLWVHRRKGFSENPHEAYIEFWGIMQAIIIQQDSICELYWAINDKKLNWNELRSWKKIREIRNICAGHPAKVDSSRNKPLKRTFMGRSFGNLTTFHYERWEKTIPSSNPGNILENITHPEIELGKLIDEYSKEATNKLVEILHSMKELWPIT